MSVNEKLKFIAENVTVEIDKFSEQYKESNKKKMKSILQNMDYEGYSRVMNELIGESIKIMNEWEEKALNELDGLTPKQFFAGMDKLEEMIDLVALLEEKNSGILPNGLTERIKDLDEKYSDELLGRLSSIQLEENKSFNWEQKAIVHIAELMASPKFINVLIAIVSQLDNELSNDKTVSSTTSALGAIGEPALQSMIKLVKDGEKKGKVYGHLLLVIAKLASKDKSDEYFSFLKDCFRQSQYKVVETNALALYGDGRAVSAIRGYVERNIGNIIPAEYTHYRQAILVLGGYCQDFDKYFTGKKA